METNCLHDCFVESVIISYLVIADFKVSFVRKNNVFPKKNGYREEKKIFSLVKKIVGNLGKVWGNEKC